MASLYERRPAWPVTWVATIELVETDEGTTVRAHVGDIIKLRLADNPTTGYRWELEPVAGGLVPLETSYEPSSSLAGSGGIGTWTVRAAEAGRVGLSLKRWRPWEGEASVQARFAVTVDVEE